MKLLIICSKKFYKEIPKIKEELIKNNIEIYLPNCFDRPDTEEIMWKKGENEHQKFKAQMYKRSLPLLMETYQK